METPPLVLYPLTEEKGVSEKHPLEELCCIREITV